MKALIALTLALFPALALSATVESWLRPPPPALNQEKPAEAVPAERFFEVPTSKLSAAEAWLADKEIIPQSQNEIGYFGQGNFQCAASMHAYLVRAIYENGGTGAFALSRHGSALLVFHGSLGAPSGPHRTALVVCLNFQPTEVFHALRGAM